MGDFQTPDELAAIIADLFTCRNQNWGRVLEPTCGRGNFIRALVSRLPAPCEIQGIELQPHYARAARELTTVEGVSATIHQGSIFNFDLARLHWETSRRLLVMGNPPWVTNAELGSLGSLNLPVKENLKGLSGLDAMTGESNFDIAEAIWIKLLRELMPQRPTIALLCKTSVARNVLSYAQVNEWPIVSASLRRINAKKWFGAAVDAALFTVEIGDGAPNYECPVYRDLHTQEPESTIGFVLGRLIADVDAYRQAVNIDGESSFVWRQGIKHDAASVMELRDNAGVFENKLQEEVSIEDAFVYPFLKSSDLCQKAAPSPRMSVIVPQQCVGQDTRKLRAEAPQLWEYLTGHEEYFSRRKSSIYTNQPPFSIFGIGGYSFAPHKVAVAGLTKTPRFWPLAPINGRPTMLDDTCYFIPCQTAEQAELLASLLNNPQCLALLRALTFSDSKRPITKRLLQRIDVMQLARLSLGPHDYRAAQELLAPLVVPVKQKNLSLF